MFEYNDKHLKIYGFKNIGDVDENKVVFLYKNKKVIVSGRCINVINLIDKSCDIDGVVTSIVMEINND